MRFVTSRIGMVITASVIGASLVLVPVLLSGALSERFDNEDAVELQRQANIESCERTNEVRRVLRVQLRTQQENLVALDPDIFNLSRAQFNEIARERQDQLRQHLVDLRRQPCQRLFPRVPNPDTPAGGLDE